jgi:hypothetical protein
VLDLPLVGRSCREGAAHYLAEAGRRDRESPLLLRSGDLAWGDALPDAQALDAAFRAPECVTKLGPLLEPYGAVVAHRHAGCRLETRVVSCLEGALGPGREHGDTTTWSR